MIAPPDAVLALAGWGAQGGMLEGGGEKDKAWGQVFAPHQTRERLRDVLAAGDIGLVAVRRGL
jgi:hypothetical protein